MTRKRPTVTSRMSENVGKIVSVQFEEIKVVCKIVGFAFQYGNERYQVEPLQGQGKQWVNKSRISFSSPSR